MLAGQGLKNKKCPTMPTFGKSIKARPCSKAKSSCDCQVGVHGHGPTTYKQIATDPNLISDGRHVEIWVNGA